MLAGGMLPLSVFHNVLPVILSISPAMKWASCALNSGLPIGFSAVITRAGVAPLPLLGCLGSVVARMLRPLEGTLRYINVGLTVGQFFRDFDK